jgi:hypothetical protein
MTEEQSEFLWGELGEKWWRESAAACRATETQLRYAACRHQGMQKNRAAALAGYSGTPEGLRSAGVRAEGTKAVEDLLTLAAAAESGGDESVATAAEIDKKLTKLIRSPDGAIALKAIEVRARHEEQRRQRGEVPENDGFSEWRTERDYLTMPGGASAYLHLIGGNIGNLCLLHDTFYAVTREDGGPELWERFRSRLNESARADLDRHLADPGWQADARRRIWGELDRKPLSPVGADAADMLQRDSVANQSIGAAAPEQQAEAEESHAA